ncbi:MAG: AraC family transcriptional regulator [Muribaculaceae bacterium]|nr:AraC family transcriptional regulator [Muribaculaceae bacterium]
MIQIKESFKGQRVLALPDSLLDELRSDPAVGNLYVRKIGFFPKAKYHSVTKPQGCPYALLLHCVDGRGWYETDGCKHIIPKNSFVILPAGMPYSFGSDNSDPWTIYWVHFCGALATRFADGSPVRGAIEPADNSRIGERLKLFEELYDAFSQAMVPGYQAYASMCLYHYLASFTMLEQYRHMAGPADGSRSFISRVMHYMNENVHRTLTLEQLSEHFRYSPSRFSAIFRAETGMSPMSCFMRTKVQHACAYLELSDLKINEISLRLGISDAAYFSRLFHRTMGMSPQAYRLEAK